MQRCSDVVEMYASRRHPQMWLWLHRRWRTNEPSQAVPADPDEIDA